MNNIKSRIAKEICHPNLGENPEKKWLAEETGELGLKFSGLDDMPVLAVFPLAHLSANGPSDERGLARATLLNQEQLEEFLERLCELKLVQSCVDGYEATEKGKNAFSSIGRNFITRKLFEMQSRVEHLDRLYEQMLTNINEGGFY